MKTILLGALCIAAVSAQDAYAQHGLNLTAVRPAAPAEIAASCSTWAKRLRAGAARPVTLLRCERLRA